MQKMIRQRGKMTGKCPITMSTAVVWSNGLGTAFRATSQLELTLYLLTQNTPTPVVKLISLEPSYKIFLWGGGIPLYCEHFDIKVLLCHGLKEH